jgi:hypothetical protein
MGLPHSGQNDELSGIFFPQLGQNMSILSCRDGADESLQETFRNRGGSCVSSVAQQMKDI